MFLQSERRLSTHPDNTRADEALSRAGSQVAQGGRVGDCLGAGHQLNQRAALRGERFFQRRDELLCFGNALSPEAMRLGQLAEIRIMKIGVAGPSGIVHLLMHTNGPQHRVIHHEDNDRKLLLSHRCELLTRHLQIAIADDRDDLTARVRERGSDCCRQAITH